jgi:hypothetical protein
MYIYDTIPEKLRIQIVHILVECLGSYDEYLNEYSSVFNAYKNIVEQLCREYGVFTLWDSVGRRDYFKELLEFFISVADPERAIDVIELSFKYADLVSRNFKYRGKVNASEVMDDSIGELNGRFRENGVGYLYEDNEIIRVDSRIVHSEVVRPALSLISGMDYKGAHEEFLSAFEHYRRGKNKEALNDALKSFESTLKIICKKQKWEFSPSDTSSKLIDICLRNELIPSFWQSKMSGLRTLLEGGVPTARNKLGGHGQGSDPINVPEYIVSYVLHMTAAAIVFLVNAERSLHR